MIRRSPTITLFPYTTLFRSHGLEEREYRISQGHDSAAAMVVDGKIVAAAAEERFSRKKHTRSEEHTSELQSHSDLVCRLLLEKKKKYKIHNMITNNYT